MHTRRRVSSTCGSVSTLPRSARPLSTQSFRTVASTCPTSQSCSTSRASLCIGQGKPFGPRPLRHGHEPPRSMCMPAGDVGGNHSLEHHDRASRNKEQRNVTGLSQRRPYQPSKNAGSMPEAARRPQRAYDVESDEQETSTRSSSRSHFEHRNRDDHEGTAPSEPWPRHGPAAMCAPTSDPIEIPTNKTLSCTYPKIADPVDQRQQIPKWQIWIQRIIFFALVVGANVGCAVAAFESFRHVWVLALLVFIKSKDILSTIAVMFGATQNLVREHFGKTEESPKWILSLICAYKETEAQIMKTVTSTLHQDLGPHKQVLCIIMDGTPGPIRSHFTAVTYTMRRPYITWQSARGELAIYAGWMDEVPVILVEKMRNAGKKDSLILGHSLFNYPREKAPLYTQLLRDEIFKTVLPELTREASFGGFDFVFCTDADSTLHDDAIRNLARAFVREKQAIAACGVLFAELAGPEVEWTTWHLFQQFQYSFGQYVRRRAEGVWGRVTCLPGCITMIAVRPEFAGALEEYASPVANRYLLPHQVQYLGTDRRLTWCMLVQNIQLRTLFVPDAMSETVAPQTLEHYLSQRRRWASNAYFNDFYYTFGPHQRLITRIFGLIDLIRLTLVFYRVINTAVFIRFLISNFYIIRIVPLLIVTKLPVLWFTLNVIFKRPVLRSRLHKLFFGLCIDQIISPFLSIVVFVNVVFRMGSAVWGKTGVSTEAAPMVGPPLGSVFSHDWAPERLNALVRDVVRSRREDQPPRLVRVSTRQSI